MYGFSLCFHRTFEFLRTEILILCYAFELLLPVTNRDHHVTYLKQLASPIAAVLAKKTVMRFEDA